MSERRRTSKPSRLRPPSTGQTPPRVPAGSAVAQASALAAFTPTQRPTLGQRSTSGPTPSGEALGDSSDDAAAAHSLMGMMATGRLDDHLGALTAAITQRQNHRLRATSSHAAALLGIGDRVRIGHTIRSHYLHGATGTVVGWAGQRAVVRLGAPTGRAINGEVRCPPLGLEVLVA